MDNNYGGQLSLGKLGWNTSLSQNFQPNNVHSSFSFLLTSNTCPTGPLAPQVNEMCGLGSAKNFSSKNNLSAHHLEKKQYISNIHWQVQNGTNYKTKMEIHNAGNWQFVDLLKSKKMVIAHNTPVSC